MSYPVEHKTVFVLDKGPLFARSCKQSIEYDVMSKTKTPGIIPAAPIMKSMWTCNVETMIEYMRVVFDIFPAKRMIRVVVGDETLNEWQQKDQNIQQVMLALGQVGPPEPKAKEDENVIRGLTQAVQVLCDPTPLQQEMDQDLIQNKGRIICLTTVKSESQMRAYEECVSDAIIQHNQLAEDSDSLLPISHCELVLIHVTPVGDETKITERLSREICPYLNGEVHVTQSGKFLYNKLIQLVQTHYGLSSTTVTGIPMKEEQNASSSANYDVELLHPSEAHDDLMKSAHSDGLVIASKEGLPTESVTLKWCTPKSNIVELQYCTCAARITPVDVNSRPSSCLTNFLLSGRAVMLEQPRKSGTKVISHMLASHGGEIFIHAINTARSLLEDPPSISEGCGGRVTDYRINDFKEFMKENRLAPALPDMLSTGVNYLNRGKTHLERMSRFWPLVIGETIIFNMASHIDPLPTIIVKEKLDDEDVLECQKAIYHVVGMESRNEPLPTSSAGTRGKGPKRDEQYKQMWAELENLIRAHADSSPQHQRVLECLLKCKKPSDDVKSSPSSTKEEKQETNTDQNYAWKELDRFQKMTEKEKQEMNKSEGGPSSVKKSRLSTDDTQFKSKGASNLLSLWTDRIKSVHSKRHMEFSGRAQSDGNQAELYQNLNKQLQENSGMDVSTPQQKGMGIQKKM